MKTSRLAALAAILCITAFCALMTQSAQAHSYQRNSVYSHPLRLVAYIVHPIGVAAEFVVTRPVHYLVSQPNADILFGHRAYPDDIYFEWKQGDGAPGIGEVNKTRQPQAPPAEPAVQ